MAHTKAEMFEVLLLATKFQNEFVDLDFVPADIPDATLTALSTALTALDKPQAHFAPHAFGFVLRDFANEQVPVVLAAIEAAEVPPVVVPPEPEPEPEPEEEPAPEEDPEDPPA